MKRINLITILLVGTSLVLSGCASTKVLDSVKVIAVDRDIPVSTKVRSTINKACGRFDGNVAQVSDWYGTKYDKAISDLRAIKSKIESVNSKARVRENAFDEEKTDLYNRQYKETVLAFENVKADLLVPLRDIKPPMIFSKNDDQVIYNYQHNLEILEENYKELNKLVPGAENAFISSLPAILSLAVDIFTTGKKQCRKNLAYVLSPQKEALLALVLPSDPWILPKSHNQELPDN